MPTASSSSGVANTTTLPNIENGTATADTVLFDMAKHRNGATDEVIAACSMRRGIFADLNSKMPAV